MKLIRQCKCSCMKKIKTSVCSCSICEHFKDAIRRFHKFQIAWHLQAVAKRKQDVIKAKRQQNIPDDEIKQYLDEHAELFECQKCNGKCHPGSKYRTFCGSPKDCVEALLCPKVRVPEMDLPKLDNNLRREAGKVDVFESYPEECCYGGHVGFTRVSGTTKPVRKCGWDWMFRDLPLHERTETDSSTGETIVHHVRACPDEYERDGKVTWMDFIKVSDVVSCYCYYFLSISQCCCIVAIQF